jgi:hypothetical protein
MKLNKRGAELSVNTIIIVVLAIIVLVVLILIFTGNMKPIIGGISDKISSIFGLWKDTSITPKA